MPTAPPLPPRRSFDDTFGDTPKARKRIARLRLLDALAANSIRAGGIVIILAVLAIFVFVAKEAVPLFLPDHSAIRPETIGVATAPERALAVGEDEYREKGWVLSSRGVVKLLDFSQKKIEGEITLEGLGSATVTCGARSPLDDVVAVGTSDGRALIAKIAFDPVFADGKRSGQTVSVAAQHEIVLREGGVIDRIAIASHDDTLIVAASGPGFLGVATKKRFPKQPKIGLGTDSLDGRTPTALALDEGGENLVVGFEDGAAIRFAVDGEDVAAVERIDAGDAALTALAYAFGSKTLLIGDAAGRVSGWQGLRSDSGPNRTLSRARDFATMDSAITAFAPSRRNKTFLVVDRSGNVRLDHVTTQRTVVELPGMNGSVAAVVSPKFDGGTVVSNDGAIERFDLDAPHPEMSLRALFGKKLYEGYDSPEYVWQSTGGTDDFEPKLSLVPLVFGSMKGVFYAMLFSVPIAILAALFVSQFASSRLRGVVKPTVELMGALPSVVVGFLAGLWLSPLVDRNLTATFLLMMAIPLAVVVAGFVFRCLSNVTRQRFVLGKELRFSLPFLVTGIVAAVLLADPIEGAFFGGDLRSFLVDKLDVRYDARNSIVVGIALGFAVIPIIFTVAEDAMSNVPRALRAASDALGASRWQTAFNLVLPAASPGIFAALMLGFGRAVGETMIVLMAAGNTPILDSSPFNGMRTISACIAVEMPEAAEGSTHARVLFLAGALLFVFAFFANTAAEVVGDRLRRRYARW